MSLPSRERGLKWVARPLTDSRCRSLPSRERGLKCAWWRWNRSPARVAPFAGAWIEISLHSRRSGPAASLPSRERGLKSVRFRNPWFWVGVAPFAGAWIEIRRPRSPWRQHSCVAPFAGAWIEMPDEQTLIETYRVAPFAGAWIEISHLL